MNISDIPFTCTPPKEVREERENRVYPFLESIGIPLFGLEHENADTMEKCELVSEKLGAEICKNLFLCNSRATDFYLLMLPPKKVFKTKFLSKQINSPRLSFASAENMKKYLDILPGSLSILGLMNDSEKKVKLLIDRELLQREYLGIHPCVNTSVLKIKTTDVLDRLLPALGRTPVFVDL